jgi:hypothetical protein
MVKFNVTVACLMIAFAANAAEPELSPSDPMYMPPEHNSPAAIAKARRMCRRLPYSNVPLVLQTCVDKNAWRFH